MPDFRLYTLHPYSGHITGVEELAAEDDRTAVDAARQRGHAVPLELWEAGRKVARIEPLPEAAAFVALRPAAA